MCSSAIDLAVTWNVPAWVGRIFQRCLQPRCYLPQHCETRESGSLRESDSPHGRNRSGLELRPEPALNRREKPGVEGVRERVLLVEHLAALIEELVTRRAAELHGDDRV